MEGLEVSVGMGVLFQGMVAGWGGGGGVGTHLLLSLFVLVTHAVIWLPPEFLRTV